MKTSSGWDSRMCCLGGGVSPEEGIDLADLAHDVETLQRYGFPDLGACHGAGIGLNAVYANRSRRWKRSSFCSAPSSALPRFQDSAGFLSAEGCSRLVGGGVALQVVLAGVVLRVPGADAPIGWAADFFVALLGFTEAGSRFVLGFLAEGPGFWESVNEALADDEENGPAVRFGIVFAFRVLPTVIFFSALTSVLYYLGILQKVVTVFAWLLQRSMRLSGPESLAAAANVFIGQTDAPLVVKPFINNMTRSELLCLMTGGMAMIAGGVFGAYVSILGGPDPEEQRLFARHLLTASLLSAPAAIVCAKLLLPQTGEIDPELRVSPDRMGENVFDAACRGTTQGLMLALNIAAMLITFLAFIALFNFLAPERRGDLSALTLRALLGGTAACLLTATVAALFLR